MLIPRFIKCLFPALVASFQPTYAQPVWSDLAPALGAHVYYVSSSTGSDSNPGTAAAPFRTLARGYAALADQSPDQLLLKCGDTWNESFGAWHKSSGDPAAKMVLASYGAGPRPKLRTNGTAIAGGEQNRAGLIIANLDLAPVAPWSLSNGITFFCPWSYVTVEGCLISGYAVNVVVQEVSANRSTGWVFRNCVIVDSNEPGSGHSQGLFMGSVDNWVIEGCVFDNNARRQADMFCHNVYIHQSAGPGIFKDNISSRACSHGVQQRPGGDMDNNLFLQNPINAYQGKCDPSFGGVPAATNYFRNNVALDSRDINTTDRRGVGFVIGGADTTIIEGNIAAHQRSGTEAVDAFDLDGIKAATIRGNRVYDWTYNGAGWGTAFHWESGGPGAVLFENNTAWQPNRGMCVRHDGRALDGSFTYRNNRYWSTNPATGYEQFSRTIGVGGSWPWWQALAGELGSSFANPGQKDATIETYMIPRGGGGLVGFITQARLLERTHDVPEFRAPFVNDWVRARLNCYADFDGSGSLSANDFQAFLNSFVAGNPAANCDGSTAVPTLNVNDFNCFLNAFAAGCP